MPWMYMGSRVSRFFGGQTLNDCDDGIQPRALYSRLAFEGQYVAELESKDYSPLPRASREEQESGHGAGCSPLPCVSREEQDSGRDAGCSYDPLPRDQGSGSGAGSSSDPSPQDMGER